MIIFVILIYTNNFLLLFLETPGSKASEMQMPTFKKQKRHSAQMTVSNFEMIRKYNTCTAYEFVKDWYIEIKTHMNMFPDLYLFGSIDGNDIETLGIIVNCYANNQSHIDFQMEVIEENEVKLVSCQVEYTKFRPDLIETSSKGLPESIINSNFELDSYESFTKSGLKNCVDLLERITNVLKYRYVRRKKTSSVLLYLQQKGKLFDKIPGDKMDAQLLALRRIYLNDLEESIAESDFKPTTEFVKAIKDESQIAKLADQCDEIHETFKDSYLFSSSFSRKVDVEKCTEAPEVYKLRSRNDFNVQVLVKSFLEKFQTSLPDALLIPYDSTVNDNFANPVNIVNETDINAKNIKFWIVDGQHTIQAAKEILTNPKFSVSEEAKHKYKERNARFLNPLVAPSVVIRICCQLNSANTVFFKTPFIDSVRSARQFLIATDKLKKRRSGNSKTNLDKVCNFILFALD